MPKKATARAPDEQLGKQPLIELAPETDAVPARMLVLAQKLQDMFDAKSEAACHRTHGKLQH